ncbi:MAG: hypothetical protein HQ568_11530 [Calditrichaeota bacterium]|nr:hypothetical protein [Calditrichota bacterium]
MSKRKPVLILGGWGSGQIVTSVIEDINEVESTWEIVGFLNDFEEIGSKIGAYPVVGTTSEAFEYADKGLYLHYAMRNAKFARSRIQRFKNMNIPNEAFATFIHPTAHVSGNLVIGKGSLLSAQVFLSVGSKISNHNHLYGNSLISHDTTLEDFAWVAGSATVGARCLIGEGAHLGTNCSLREDVKIGAYAIVGIGAVIIQDVGEGDIAVGNPARIIGNVSQYKDDKSAPPD